MSDSVNEFGLGSENTQGDGPSPHGDPGHGLEHGLGPSEGPYVGEAAEDEEGTRFGLGSDNTQETPPVDEPPSPDPLEHGLGE